MTKQEKKRAKYSLLCDIANIPAENYYEKDKIGGLFIQGQMCTEDESMSLNAMKKRLLSRAKPWFDGWFPPTDAQREFLKLVTVKTK